MCENAQMRSNLGTTAAVAAQRLGKRHSVCSQSIRQSETSVLHLGVAERPDDGVDDQLELRRRHREQRLEAVPRDGVQQAEELQAVLRIVLCSGAII